MARPRRGASWRPAGETDATGYTFFEPAPLPRGIELVLSHKVEWGGRAGSPSLEYHYNWLDYAFTHGAVHLVCRCYRDEPNAVSIGAPSRQGAEGDWMTVEDDALMRAVVRYFVEREFRTIKVLDVGGYVRLKPEDPLMQAARA